MRILNRVNFFVILLLLLGITIFSWYVTAAPNGASVTPGTPGTAPADAAGSNSAQAGNVTELTINGYSTTQTWQGYFGNVTGAIQLANANDNVLYNWSNANPSGEIYASTNNSVLWNLVQCFNFTATGNMTNNQTGETAGATNLFGMNISQLEGQYGLASDDIDGVNETFTLTDHDAFFTNSLQFSANECRSTRVFGSGGSGADQQFEEVLLYEANTDSVIFTALIEDSLSGFDQRPHDFEMLVLEDGHNSDTTATNYFFFLEIE